MGRQLLSAAVELTSLRALRLPQLDAWPAPSPLSTLRYSLSSGKPMAPRPHAHDMPALHDPSCGAGHAHRSVCMQPAAVSVAHSWGLPPAIDLWEALLHCCGAGSAHCDAMQLHVRMHQHHPYQSQAGWTDTACCTPRCHLKTHSVARRCASSTVCCPCSHLTVLGIADPVGNDSAEGADDKMIATLVEGLPQLRAQQLWDCAYYATTTGLLACSTSACFKLLRHPTNM